MALYNNYDPNQIMSMQNDAIRRVNEMQRRSREKVMASQGEILKNQKPPEQASLNETQYDENLIASNKNGIGGFIGSLFNNGQNALTGILDKLNLDSEVILILMIMLLLANEGADMMLLLALVYIML